MGRPERVLVDTGPLVALFNKRDNWHPWVVESTRHITGPLITCDAVISEALFLLEQHTDEGAVNLYEMIERDLLVSQFDLSKHKGRVLSLLKKYRDLPASFADACLISLCEESGKARIFTVDDDFLVYRDRNRKVIPLIFPRQ